MPDFLDGVRLDYGSIDVRLHVKDIDSSSCTMKVTPLFALSSDTWPHGDGFRELCV